MAGLDQSLEEFGINHTGAISSVGYELLQLNKFSDSSQVLWCNLLSLANRVMHEFSVIKVVEDEASNLCKDS